MVTPVGSDIAAIADQCVAVLGHAPSGLFTDIDGTISEMAARPDLAMVEPTARAALEAISGQIAMTGVVTGRALDVAEGLVGLPSLLYVGNHGLERSLAGEHWDHPAAVAARSALRTSLVAVGEAAERHGMTDGLILEDKRLSATVHYRQMPDPDRFAEAIGDELHAIAVANGLKVMSGRMIFELRPDTMVTKGTALRDVIVEHGLRGVVFAGDDTTDVDAFRAIATLREEGTIHGLRIGVIGKETPQAVFDESDVHVADVETVSRLFTEIARRLSAAPVPIR